ncbi:hypothetical protein [Thalassotalea agarivorans]|uniref:hypothetical protein n=1 Tax=Thalassotalea agarivorans TaxID=349064 RepID=UPI0025734571|nr:hypothetical protein [Thalassotalea agarivorans]
MLAVVFSLIFAIGFYCAALANGLGRKRWAFAGMLFGPAVLPLFFMKRRTKGYQQYGWDCLIFKA